MPLIWLILLGTPFDLNSPLIFSEEPPVPSPLGSAVLVKNSIGVAAVIVMAVIIGIPLLKLVVMAFLYQLLGAVLEPVADSRIVKAVLVLSGSLENMIYMIAVTVVLMCLTMAIICFATNINLYV